MIAKELRALLPVWAAVAAAMVASALLRELRPFNGPVYVIGASVLGAMSMGHEYSHRTMALMLTLPIARRRILLTKLSVLAVLLLGLALLSTVVVSAGRGDATAGPALRWLPIIAALFISPALTLAARSPVAGAVFTLGLGGLLLIAGEWIGMQKYGYTRNVDVFRMSFLWTALPLLSAAATALMWWVFPRLQVADGRGDLVDLAPAGAATSPTLTRRSPTRLLIGKELRLQQLALTLAALYLVVFVAIVMQMRNLFYRNDAAFLVSMIYAGLLTVVIGSMAGAEERHLGTLDAQLLLPIPTSRQWLVKVCVVFALTLILAILLPAAMAIALQPEHVTWGRSVPTVAGLTIVALMALATVSLYVSTLCSSGVWSLVLSVPAAFGVATFVSKLAEITQGVIYSFDGRPDWAVIRWTSAAMAVTVMGIVLRLALGNYRSADRSRARIAAQVGIAAAASVAAVIVVGIAGALSR